MEICPLASGSSGNCIYVGSKETKILIDAGISAARIVKSLTHIGHNLEDIDALFLTHEHVDHCREVGRISRNYGIPVHLNLKTYWAGRSYLNKAWNIRYFDHRRMVRIKDLFIKPFPVFHDAISPSGFRINDENTTVGMAVDLGVVTEDVKENLRDCEILVIESNHDLSMLITGDYPWHLKQRIRSQMGHLSNKDAGETIREMLREGKLRQVYLAHISQNNNRPEVAVQTVKGCLGDGLWPDFELHLTWHHKMSKCIKV